MSARNVADPPMSLAEDVSGRPLTANAQRYCLNRNLYPSIL